MEQYKKWLEEQIEVTLEDKDLQREHWAYCTAYKKLIEALPIHGVVRGGDKVRESVKRVEEYLEWVKGDDTPNTPTEPLPAEGVAQNGSGRFYTDEEIETIKRDSYQEAVDWLK